jgi:hypothetical protein
MTQTARAIPIALPLAHPVASTDAVHLPTSTATRQRFRRRLMYSLASEYMFSNEVILL